MMVASCHRKTGELCEQEVTFDHLSIVTVVLSLSNSLSVPFPSLPLHCTTLPPAGNYQCALETYRKVHERFPDNLECELPAPTSTKSVWVRVRVRPCT